jgi:hypothetical protein
MAGREIIRARTVLVRNNFFPVSLDGSLEGELDSIITFDVSD